LIFSRLLSLFVLVRGKSYALILLYLLVIGSTAVEAIGIASFYPLAEMLQDASQLSYYRDTLAAWIPAVGSLNQEQFLSYSLVALATLFVFKSIFLVLAGYGNIRVVTHLYRSWMNRIFKIYMDKSYSFFMENKAGDLVQRKIMQTHKAASALRIFTMFLGSLTTIFGVFLVLCFVNLEVTLTIVALMIPVYYITMKISQGRIYKAGDRIVKLEKRGFELTTEVLSGIKQVKVFCAEDHFQRQVQKIWQEHSRHSIQNQFMSILPRPILETMIVVGGVCTALIFMRVSGYEKNIMPMLAVFAMGIYRILPLAAASSAQAMTIASLFSSAETVANLLSEKVEEEKGLALPTMTDKIEFQNVSFSYSKREMVLDNLSLTFGNNKFYGVVGVSGSGKSTIIDLMTGFFKPQKGRVLIDGVDLSDADVSTWLCQLGLISQEAFIFSGTIEDNICFGVDVDDRDQGRIKEATQIAYADEFIDTLPEGYQTMVGERGVKLSGGQRQRLAIARAIYLDPPVLIFDEATSSLDANSEKKVQEAIEALHGKRTVIVVAHRLVTISKADHIYVIENGNLTEEGTHEDLRMSKGLYSRLCAKQSLN
jgi:ABC-type multidrug transport system fused ATPase/permease subunit